ncbi:MAG: alanine racemase, partial [Desulfovibrio sp.]|nr:alanine racemase [Desulfovibrio sp.]
MDAFSSACVCHIDLDAIAHNFRVLGAPGGLMPVIKADAYGHGLAAIARELDSAGAARFAVGLAQEGAILREMGLRQQIVLLMGCVAGPDWELALRHELTPLIG